MVLGVPKVDGDGLGVSDMQITIWLGREPSHHPFASSLQVLPPVLLVDLGVFAGCMESREEPVREE
jgi:hypothetical protein